MLEVTHVEGQSPPPPPRWDCKSERQEGLSPLLFFSPGSHSQQQLLLPTSTPPDPGSAAPQLWRHRRRRGVLRLRLGRFLPGNWLSESAAC